MPVFLQSLLISLAAKYMLLLEAFLTKNYGSVFEVFPAYLVLDLFTTISSFVGSSITE